MKSLKRKKIIILAHFLYCVILMVNKLVGVCKQLRNVSEFNNFIHVKYHSHANLGTARKPASSEVLTCYLKQTNFPPWTSYFVKYSSISDDQWGYSHFNWTVDVGHNYHILRTGCYPYIKYHCTKRPVENLAFENSFFRFIKVLNLGIPCLAYGIAAKFLLKSRQAFTEVVITSNGPVTIYFLYKEDKGSSY